MDKDSKMLVITDILDKIGDRLGSPDTVKQLCLQNVTDYERGIIAGQISLLGEIKTSLIPTVKKEEIPKSKKKIGTDDRVKHES